MSRQRRGGSSAVRHHPAIFGSPCWSRQCRRVVPPARLSPGVVMLRHGDVRGEGTQGTARGRFADGRHGCGKAWRRAGVRSGWWNRRFFGGAGSGNCRWGGSWIGNRPAPVCFSERWHLWVRLVRKRDRRKRDCCQRRASTLSLTGGRHVRLSRKRKPLRPDETGCQGRDQLLGRQDVSLETMHESPTRAPDALLILLAAM